MQSKKLVIILIVLLFLQNSISLAQVAKNSTIFYTNTKNLQTESHKQVYIPEGYFLQDMGDRPSSISLIQGQNNSINFDFGKYKVEEFNNLSSKKNCYKNSTIIKINDQYSRVLATDSDGVLVFDYYPNSQIEFDRKVIKEDIDNQETSKSTHLFYDAKNIESTQNSSIDSSIPVLELLLGDVYQFCIPAVKGALYGDDLISVSVLSTQEQEAAKTINNNAIEVIQKSDLLNGTNTSKNLGSNNPQLNGFQARAGFVNLWSGLSLGVFAVLVSIGLHWVINKLSKK
jgi:hypothetical protein